MPHRDLRFSHDYVEDAPPIVPVQGAVSGKAGGPVTDHSHTASGDGGAFDAANLRSDEDAENGAVLSSDGEEGSEWRLLTLGSLSDVNAPDPDDGDTIAWDDSAGEWVASPPAGGAMALDDLTDVDAAAPDDEDVLTWDDVAGKWVAAPPAGGAVDAGDVTYTPTTATDWDSSADPGNADDAFDQLAKRVKDIEDAGGGGAPDASAVTYTPTTATDWDSDADPGDVDQALDQLAERVDDIETAPVLVLDGKWNQSGEYSGSAYAWKGNYIKPVVSTTIYAMSALMGNWLAAGTYKFGVFTVAANAVASIVAMTDAFAPSSDIATWLYKRLATPVTLTAGTTYLLAVGRTDDADDYILPVSYPGTLVTFPFPSATPAYAGSGRIAKAAPAVSDTVNQFTAGHVALGVIWELP